MKETISLDNLSALMYISFNSNKANQMTKTLLKDIKAKNGNTIVAGSIVEVSFPKEYNGRYVRITKDNVSVTTYVQRLHVYFNIKTPSMSTIENWVNEGIAKSIGGKTVEPDGWDVNDTPSWLLALGLI
jgi:hypothetical protein